MLYSVFIEPSLARVGLSEEEAINKGYDIKVAKLPVAAIPRARTIDETDGIMKAVNNVVESVYYLSESGLLLLPFMSKMIDWSNNYLYCGE